MNTLVHIIIGLIVALVIGAILLYITRAILALLPPPIARFNNVIYGLILLLLALAFISFCLGGFNSFGPAFRV